MPQLTYGNTTHTTIQAILTDGEKLGTLEGPGVFFMQVNGDDPAYRSILEEYAQKLEDEGEKGGKKSKKDATGEPTDYSGSVPPGMDPHGYPYIGRYGVKITEAAIAALVADIKDPLATEEAREAEEARQKKQAEELEERARANQTEEQHAAGEEDGEDNGRRKNKRHK